MNIGIKNQYSSNIKREDRPLTPKEKELYNYTQNAAIGRREILHRKVNDLGLSIDFKAKTSWDQFMQKTPDSKFHRQKSKSPLNRNEHSQSTKQFNLNLSKFQMKQFDKDKRQDNSQIDTVFQKKLQSKLSQKENLNIHFGQGDRSQKKQYGMYSPLRNDNSITKLVENQLKKIGLQHQSTTQQNVRKELSFRKHSPLRDIENMKKQTDQYNTMARQTQINNKSPNTKKTFGSYKNVSTLSLSGFVKPEAQKPKGKRFY